MNLRDGTLTLLLLASAVTTAASAQGAAGGTCPRAPKGVIDPNSMAGADMGAKVNAAIAAMASSGGTVRIPAGTYDFATTIKMSRSGQHLACDSGAVLHYTGGGDAILVDPAAAGAMVLSIDGEGGCELLGNPKARNGIELMPGNTFVIRGMRISDFAHGNAIELSGANSVEIGMNAIIHSDHGLDMVTRPGFAPNAVHVTNNEFGADNWAVYSHDGHFPASRALGNVYRDNVFEGNKAGDLFLGWDAHTVVEGNYFESDGVGVAAGAGDANVFDIQIVRNYFTTGGYRSEVELGYGFGFHIEGNYEEGPNGAGTGCAVNAIPGPHGGTSKVTLRNAFLRASERQISAHEFCYQGSPIIPPGVLGENRIAGDEEVAGSVRAKGAELTDPLKLGRAEITATESTLHSGDACAPEGTLTISTPAGQAARLFFCSGGHWASVVAPHP